MDVGTLKGKRGAIYARFSSENQREASIDDQVRNAIKLVESRGGALQNDRVFQDSAISGATIERPGLKKLLALVEAGLIDYVVCEDQSRLSRDAGHAADILKRLNYHRVRLLTVDGIDTTKPEAKFAYSMKSVMSEFFIDDLRRRTLRGLEGRALAGHATGAPPYGYANVPVADSSGRVVGHEIRVVEDRAGIVRRIFTQYAQGHVLASIAKALTADGIAPPRARRGRKPGWVDSAIREMLLNTKYTGIFAFGKRTWLRDPSSGRRRPRAREDGPLPTTMRDDLRIVDQQLWAEVQARFATRKRVGSRPARRSYLFSGLLVCGVCGAPMTICGGDADRRYYRCSHNRARRTCPNSSSILERVVRERLLEAIRARVQTPEGIAYVRKRVALQLREAMRTHQADVDERRARLARTEDRIRNLIELLASGERSERVVTALRDLEAQADAEKAAIAALQELAGAPIQLPDNEAIVRRVFDLDRLLTRDVDGGRQALRRLIKDGAVRLVPDAAGTYTAHCELLPLAVLLTERQTPPSSGGVYQRVVAGARYGTWTKAITAPFAVELAA